MEEKEKSKLKKIADFSDLSYRIESDFCYKFPYMEFLLAYNSLGQNYVFQEIRSLPRQSKIICCENRGICLYANWKYKKDIIKNILVHSKLMDWEDVGSKKIPPLYGSKSKRSDDFYAHGKIFIPLVNKVCAFNSGFEIKSEVGLSLIAVECKAVKEIKAQMQEYDELKQVSEGDLFTKINLLKKTYLSEWFNTSLSLPSSQLDYKDMKWFWSLYDELSDVSDEDFENMLDAMAFGEKPDDIDIGQIKARDIDLDL